MIDMRSQPLWKKAISFLGTLALFCSISSAMALNIGNPAPDFTLPSYEGKE